MVSCDLSKYHLLKRERHHHAFEIEIHTDLSNEPSSTDSYMDFRNADYNIINNFFQQEKWEFTTDNRDIQEKIKQFYEIVNSAIADNVKTKTVIRSNHPKWFGKELVTLKNKVSSSYKLMKSTGTTEAKINHSTLRKDYKKKSRLAFKLHKIEMEQLINEDPKKFYEHVNATRK